MPGERVERLKLLIVAFYFPPAGGGGVQRPLKLAGYLASFGLETHVLSPADPKWIHHDPSLADPVGVLCHRVPYVGPKGRLPAEELYGRVGIDRLRHRARLFPRRLLAPDENVLWLLSAVPAAVRLVRRSGIEVVVTTSPPSSVHLVGAAVAQITGIAWVADLRDSIVAKPDRRVERAAVRAKERTHRAVARLIAREAAGVVAVTETIAEEMRALDCRGELSVIANGADFEDFEGLAYTPGASFRITHTGSFFGKRDPRPFLRALQRSGPDVVARFVGDFRARDREWCKRLGLGSRLELRPFLSHREALALQRDSEALLLLLPEEGGRGIDVPSGKLFEYLAARRPIIAAVPPQGAAADLIRRAEAGIVVDSEDEDGIQGAIADLRERWAGGWLEDTRLPRELRDRIDRRARAEEFAAILRRTAAQRGESRRGVLQATQGAG